MGSEYAGYTADITVSFPANGKFTDKQKFVYETCYKANRKVIAAMKPGIERERERDRDIRKRERERQRERERDIRKRERAGERKRERERDILNALPRSKISRTKNNWPLQHKYHINLL